ncbi:hypothetical protein PF008_g29679 [Phytophthora fragariae]|uniref:ZSWIM1/3 RNaseH-like domain-containing protein n=1 Tax=Phytophthora fragariae TaxID=53985 RepID=A0A6G0Q884_9STRA|nr:hypothetical protein PF008_g29679 [Phytophthora fragariae]
MGTGYRIRVASEGIKHNHKLSKLTFDRYPENRAVSDPVMLARVDAMRKSGAKARGILMYLREECANKATILKDIHNLMARLKASSNPGDTDADCAESVLRDLCEHDKGAVASLFVDSTRVLQTASFQSRKMRHLFAAFPEVLLVDTTFGTNVNRYKLFSFVVHDIHGKGQYVQHALMTSESKAHMKDAKKVVALCDGSQEHKQALKDIFAAMHPLFKYFLKNWDGITEEWVSYQRSNVPHLGNNTNNRIEAKWAKLKDLIRPSAGVYECLATLLGLQGICENEYEVELNKIGTFCLPKDDEYQCMDKRQLGELKQLANMAEFKAALRVSTSYKICIRQDSVVELLNEDEKRQHLLSLEDFTCSCIFSQTQLLPCRHAFYYRRSTIAFAGTQFESIIPFKISTQGGVSNKS